MSRSLVILTLNEREGVERYRSLLQNPPAQELLVVDGGSTDGTRELLDELGVKWVPQARRGRGEAFRVGVSHTRGDFIVFFSPDGNEDEADIDRLFLLLEGGSDMAIASRFLSESVNEEDGSLLPMRKWVNMVFTLIANLLWNRGRPYISDSINGFRGLRRAAFEAINPQSLRFTIEYEMTIGAMQRGLRISEIPTREGQRVGGQSKAISLPVGLDFLRFLWGQLRADWSRGRIQH